jgi:hypothetical protein
VVNILSRSALMLFVALLGSGCDDAPPDNTGGTSHPPGSCGRGLVVVGTDYQSTNVSLVGIDGKVVSSSFFSSATKLVDNTDPSNNLPSLSGDVVLPTMPQTGGRVTTIDRSFGMLTWVDVKSGAPIHRLPIGDNIPLNLQDYVEVSPNKAYVPVLDPKLDPMLGPLEKGSNIVIVDPTARTITGVIDLSPAMAGEDPKFYPHPGHAFMVGKRLYVLLSASTINYDAWTLSRLVTIDTDTDTILAVDKIDGMRDCTGLGLSPSQAKIAVTCSGTWQVDPTLGNPTSDPSTSGLVILSRGDAGITEDKRWFAKDIGGGTLGFTVSFVDEDAVVFTTIGQGSSNGQPARDDTFVALDLLTGTPQVLLHNPKPGSIGDVRCFPACGACFVAEAGGAIGGTLHRFEVTNGALGARMDIEVDPEIGLPPRFLGQF